MKPLSLLGGLARDRRQPDAPMAARLVVVGRKAKKVSERGQYAAETLALVDGLLAKCAARHGVTPEAARRRRIPPAVAARHEWIRLLRDTWALTPSETARMVGMDYATVQYALGWRR